MRDLRESICWELNSIVLNVGFCFESFLVNLIKAVVGFLEIMFTNLPRLAPVYVVPDADFSCARPS